MMSYTFICLGDRSTIDLRWTRIDRDWFLVQFQRGQDGDDVGFGWVNGLKIKTISI